MGVLRRLFIAATVSLGFAAGIATAADITVFAAASTTTAVEAVADLFAARNGGRVRGVFASSSTLARQIANGAPADVYISANAAWMDWLEAANAVEPGTRRTLLGNRLVLVAPADSPLSLGIAAGFPLVAKLAGGRLVMGDPDHVPAGIYGRAALQRLGVWPALAGSVVRAADTRAALALVDRGEAAAGIVYATDAAIGRNVRVVGTFPEDTHPAIVYPAAIVAGRDRPQVRAFFKFLASPAAADVFREHGFTVREASP